MSEELIPIKLTRVEAQFFSVLATVKGDEATQIMCDQIVESGDEVGQVTLANKIDFDDYLSLLRKTASGSMANKLAPGSILRRMTEMVR